MTQSMVTIVSPLALDRLDDARDMIAALGNPARPDVAAALAELHDGSGVHFASLHAIRTQDGARGYIVLEFSADGTEAQAIERVASAIGDPLRSLFMLAGDWTSDAKLADYLLRHRVAVGAGWFSNPGVVFAGTPGMTVGQIQAEDALAKQVAELLGAQQGNLRGLERVEAVRRQLAGSAMLQAPVAVPPPYDPPSTLGLVGPLLGSFAVTFLWPVGLVLLLVAVGAGFEPHRTFLGHAWSALWRAGLAALILLIAAAALIYSSLRHAEAEDALEERSATRATQSDMFERENRCAQNHMISITQRKPGVVRAITSRLIFWIIGELATLSYRPGFLSGIGTIHFARWVTPPGSPDVLFFSNYDGSWESYLEDFITRAHTGLTGVWSNSIGFPRSSNLIQDGATDGERFKRYARHSMQPTLFWYSGYPKLTTSEIRTNAQIRLGLSGAMTEQEAAAWLALFGSTERPVEKLLTSEIQSLVFGGLKFMPHGVCLILGLPPDRAEARAWLAGLRPDLAFNDGRHLQGDAVATLGLGATGLAALGLPAECLETFPYAFAAGMVSDSRSRILGDTGDNAPAHWHWGGTTPPDATVLIYGRTEQAAAAKLTSVLADAAARGVNVLAQIPLVKVDKSKTEPFGFADGISQPLIRGTYKSLRNADPIHLVEPGEFILGYPDNRANIPPGPVLPATFDPDNMLPLVGTPTDFSRTVVETPRDVGFNGSYLVIRQLEQDVDGFHAYCADQAARLAGRLPAPYEVTPDFIGAKLVGRWQDGASLVRNPYAPPGERHPRTEQARPTTTPIAATPIERATKAPRFHEDNDFLFGTEDPEALRCPLGAHIRRANPRDSMDPGSSEQIAITNRHRILRVGRQYVPKPGQKPGLLFMCLNGDIERQFEFVQQTWLKSPTFHGLTGEKDPLLGDAETGVCGFTIPSRDGPVRLSPMAAFVSTCGGGYFFLPGKRLIDFLSTP